MVKFIELSKNFILKKLESEREVTRIVTDLVKSSFPLKHVDFTHCVSLPRL